MALLSSATRKVPIPHEQGQWMEVRTAIAPYQVERAADAATEKSVRQMAALGATVIKAFTEANEGKEAAPDAAVKRSAVDLDVLAEHAVVAWSYTPTEPTIENIQMLDRETRRWLHDLVWEAARPRTEAERDANLGESSPHSKDADTSPEA